MTTRRALLTVSLLALAALVAVGEARPKKEGRDKASEARLRKDLYFLASPACEGRGPTTEGINRAADYVAARFKEIGLKPGFKGSYFQPFAIRAAVGKLTLVGPRGQTVELKQGAHFQPMGLDQKGKLDAPVVFAGYGVKTKEPAYDDYDGLNVKGKIVVLLRDAPRVGSATRPAPFNSAAALQAKLRTAMQHGAVGVLVANDAANTAAGDAPPDMSYSGLMSGGKRVPAMFVRRSVVEMMLPAGVTLEGVEKGIDRDLGPNSFDLPGWTVRMEVDRQRDRIPLKNVIGVLEGSGPLAKETVVVGAHYDHLGYGGTGSSRAGTKLRAVHHGADDNASGTAGMIELARRFAAMPNRQGRRLVFIAFSGEEIGLLGSQHYCEHPVFPLKQTAAMFNLDMIGRLRDDRKTGKPRLLTEGHGTAKPFKEMIDGLAKKYDFTLSSQASGMGPSDHASFTGKKVPVLFFWTGTHPDYHMPSDTADKINAKGMRTVVDMSEEVVAALATMDRPAFVEVKGGGGMRPSSGPRLGLRPDYYSTDGVEVEGVPEGSVADRGGIKAGDKIVSIGGHETKDIRQYMQAMAKQKAGTTVEIVVERGKKKVTLKVKLD